MFYIVTPDELGAKLHLAACSSLTKTRGTS